jgi:hypothetical protein
MHSPVGDEAISNPFAKIFACDLSSHTFHVFFGIGILVERFSPREADLCIPTFGYFEFRPPDTIVFEVPQ